MALTGEVYWRKGHPYVVLSDPNHPSGMLLYVNLTTLDDECPDDECILTKSDYAWVKHRTAVAFTRAEVVEVRKFEEAVRRGLLRPGFPRSVPAECLIKIQESALKSKHLSLEKKNLIPGFKRRN